MLTSGTVKNEQSESGGCLYITKIVTKYIQSMSTQALEFNFGYKSFFSCKKQNHFNQSKKPHACKSCDRVRVVTELILNVCTIVLCHLCGRNMNESATQNLKMQLKDRMHCVPPQPITQ